jgi:teichuronic acid biosynthesis glycosyltransferase TuaC
LTVGETSLVARVHRDPEATALLVTNMWPGDPELPVYGIFVRRQVESLIRGGLRCDVLYVRGHRSPFAYPLAALLLLAWNLRRPRYTLVHALAGEALLAARGYVRAPVVVTFRGSDLLGKPGASGAMPLSWRFRRRFLSQLARLTSATVTVSRQLEDMLPAAIRPRNTVLPTGIDQERFRPGDREAARSELGWPMDERSVLFAADPQRLEKGYELASAVVARARERRPSIRMRMAAEDVPHELMPTLMTAADCLLLTSANEGSPNAVKEALACNLPVVATDVGDVRDLLDGVAPSYVCTHAVAELSEALVACVEPPRRSNGRARSSALSEELVAARLLQLYQAVKRRRRAWRTGAN